MKEMNCRAFKIQVADWEAGRLAPEQSLRMADHRGRCERCAREAQAERGLRGLWRAAPTAPPNPALWSQIAQRLDDPARAERCPFSALRPPRRTFAGAVGLAALTVCGLWLGTKVPSEPPTTTRATLPAAPMPAPQAAPVRYASWTGLPDASQVDPAVDDPAGPNTERIWALINARRVDAR